MEHFERYAPPIEQYICIPTVVLFSKVCMEAALSHAVTHLIRLITELVYEGSRLQPHTK